MDSYYIYHRVASSKVQQRSCSLIFCLQQFEKSSQTTTEQGGAFIEKYKEYTELETLTSDIANDVVKRVTVYKDGGIEIELALRDE